MNIKEKIKEIEYQLKLNAQEYLKSSLKIDRDKIEMQSKALRKELNNLRFFK